jgi:hypothetical protein
VTEKTVGTHLSSPRIPQPRNFSECDARNVWAHKDAFETNRCDGAERSVPRGFPLLELIVVFAISIAIAACSHS